MYSTLATTTIVWLQLITKQGTRERPPLALKVPQKGAHAPEPPSLSGACVPPSFPPPLLRSSLPFPPWPAKHEASLLLSLSSIGSLYLSRAQQQSFNCGEERHSSSSFVLYSLFSTLFFSSWVLLFFFKCSSSSALFFPLFTFSYFSVS